MPGPDIVRLAPALAVRTASIRIFSLTHTHMDHITGFPFFRPAYNQNNTFQIWAGHLAAQNGNIRSVLSAIMSKPVFPVPLRIMHACMAFHDFNAGDTLNPLPDIALRTAPLIIPMALLPIAWIMRDARFAM